MKEANNVRHSIIHRDAFAYCAHAHIAAAADGSWLVVFNRAPRRDFVLHPPEDPLYRNVIVRSVDGGQSWSSPQVVPNYGFSGTECAGLTRLQNGNILLNQWRFDWYPLGLARTFKNQSVLSYPETFMRGWLASPEHDATKFSNVAPADLTPWVRGGGSTFVHISNDNGASFSQSVEIATSPFSGGYGMRGAAQLPDGTIAMPLSDTPNYRQVFVVRSSNGGHSWSVPSLAAAGEGHEFEEPAILHSKSGKLVMVMRDNCTRYLHQTDSRDGGQSWTRPKRLEIEGYPAHLLALDDGRLLLTYGWRQPDFGIRAVLSNDDGESWDTQGTIRVRSDLPNKNLGYPATIQADNGELFTVYYGEDGMGCTCIMGTSWQL